MWNTKSNISSATRPIGGKVSGLVVAASADAEAKTIDRRAGRRRRLGAADLADLAAAAETIEVFAARREPVGLDMHAVTELRPCDRGARSARRCGRSDRRRPATTLRRSRSACRRPRAAPARAASTARRSSATDRPTPRRARTDSCGRLAAPTPRASSAAARRSGAELPGDVEQRRAATFSRADDRTGA